MSNWVCIKKDILDVVGEDYGDWDWKVIEENNEK